MEHHVTFFQLDFTFRVIWLFMDHNKSATYIFYAISFEYRFILYYVPISSFTYIFQNTLKKSTLVLILFK